MHTYFFLSLFGCHIIFKDNHIIYTSSKEYRVFFVRRRKRGTIHQSTLFSREEGYVQITRLGTTRRKWMEWEGWALSRKEWMTACVWELQNDGAGKKRWVINFTKVDQLALLPDSALHICSFENVLLVDKFIGIHTIRYKWAWRIIGFTCSSVELNDSSVKLWLFALLLWHAHLGLVSAGSIFA